MFVRYQSFKNGQELKAAIQKRVPSKIDIGPVYNVDPQKRAAYANQGGGFAPQERELVFDIDLTVRFGSGASLMSGYPFCRLCRPDSCRLAHPYIHSHCRIMTT